MQNVTLSLLCKFFNYTVSPKKLHYQLMRHGLQVYFTVMLTEPCYVRTLVLDEIVCPVNDVISSFQTNVYPVAD